LDSFNELGGNFRRFAGILSLFLLLLKLKLFDLSLPTSIFDFLQSLPDQSKNTHQHNSRHYCALRPASISSKLRVDSGNPVRKEEQVVDADNHHVLIDQMLVIQLTLLEWPCNTDVDYLSRLKVGQKHYLEIT
jgi:hypothetical protein